MRIIKVKGGLGNQMFQYGFAKYVEMLTGEAVKIDMSSYEAEIEDKIRKPRLLKYNISLDIASLSEIKRIRKFQVKGSPLSIEDKIKNILEAIFNSKYYMESDRAYRKPESLLKYMYLDGYWQSWRYLVDIEDQLRKEFTPNYCMNIATINLQNKMKNLHKTIN